MAPKRQTKKNAAPVDAEPAPEVNAEEPPTKKKVPEAEEPEVDTDTNGDAEEVPVAKPGRKAKEVAKAAVQTNKNGNSAKEPAKRGRKPKQVKKAVQVSEDSDEPAAEEANGDSAPEEEEEVVAPPPKAKGRKGRPAKVSA